MKWFAPYDVAEQPRPLSVTLSVMFWQPVSVAVLVFMLVCMVERSRIGVLSLASIERFGSVLRPRSGDLYRAGTAAFFVSLWVLGNIILTPELKTSLPDIRWLQFAIAAGMFWRPTMIVSAAGIVALYAYATYMYGVFHLMDYPIFLGLAAYLGLTGAGVKTVFNLRPIDIARWAVAITLIWASCEKFAYPQWTVPLLVQHPSLCMGFSVPYYMNAAGVVEFSLGFGLLWSPLVRRLSAIVLAAMFTSAIYTFGIIDAIGHMMIIVTLVTIAVNNAPAPRQPALAPPLYGAALAAVIAVYWGGHALFFGTTIW